MKPNNPGHVGYQFANLNMKGGIASLPEVSREIKAWL